MRFESLKREAEATTLVTRTHKYFHAHWVNYRPGGVGRSRRVCFVVGASKARRRKAKQTERSPEPPRRSRVTSPREPLFQQMTINWRNPLLPVCVLITHRGPPRRAGWAGGWHFDYSLARVRTVCHSTPHCRDLCYQSMSAHSALTPSEDPTQQILWRKRELDYENQLLVKALSLALFREDCILSETIELEVEFNFKA